MVEGVSSKSPLLTSYFNHWEMRIYSTLRSMLSKNLRAVTDCIARATPLFTIDIRLSSPDIILLPSASEVRMTNTVSMSDHISKSFPRLCLFF